MWLLRSRCMIALAVAGVLALPARPAPDATKPKAPSDELVKEDAVKQEKAADTRPFFTANTFPERILRLQQWTRLPPSPLGMGNWMLDVAPGAAATPSYSASDA